MKVGIIGGGRVGSRLAASLREAGVLAGITAASEQHSAQLAQQFGVPVTDNAMLWQEADVLLLTVPDRLIGTVAEKLAQSVTPAAKVVLHVSGSVGLEPLAPLTQLGAHVGSLHPLQSFAGGNTQLAGVYMALDGDSEAQDAGKKLVELFGGKAFSLSCGSVHLLELCRSGGGYGGAADGALDRQQRSCLGGVVAFVQRYGG